MKWSMRETQSLTNDTRKKEKKGKKNHTEAKKRERGGKEQKTEQIGSTYSNCSHIDSTDLTWLD